MQPGLRDGGKKQVAARHAPQHPALGSSSNPRHEERGRSTINRAASAAGNFMKRPEGQPATWKGLVHLWNSEWQDGSCARLPAFELADTLSKLGKHRIEGTVRHDGIDAPSGVSSRYLS